MSAPSTATVNVSMIINGTTGITTTQELPDVVEGNATSAKQPTSRVTVPPTSAVSSLLDTPILFSVNVVGNKVGVVSILSG